MSESESDVDLTPNLSKDRETEQAEAIRFWNPAKLPFPRPETPVPVNNKTLKNELPHPADLSEQAGPDFKLLKIPKGQLSWTKAIPALLVTAEALYAFWYTSAALVSAWAGLR